MKNRSRTPGDPGPFRADRIRPGDPYELSEGRLVECLPTGGRGSRANRLGAQVLGTDPDVDSVGVDTGFTPREDTLRAPDVAVGNVPDAPGWVKGVPPLAVEYADTGQNDADLRKKIRELLAAGSRWIWVVRLAGPRCVEVHEAGRPLYLARPGDLLEAPGVLRNPVPVDALYDEGAANAATLHNLLQRHGYDSLEQVRAEAKTEGRVEGRLESLREALSEVMEVRGLAPADTHLRAIAECMDSERLKAWLGRAGVATSAQEVFYDHPS